MLQDPEDESELMMSVNNRAACSSACSHHKNRRQMLANERWTV